jgi:hypothetical protein
MSFSSLSLRIRNLAEACEKDVIVKGNADD